MSFTKQHSYVSLPISLHFYHRSPTTYSCFEMCPTRSTQIPSPQFLCQPRSFKFSSNLYNLIVNILCFISLRINISLSSLCVVPNPYSEFTSRLVFPAFPFSLCHLRVQNSSLTVTYLLTTHKPKGVKIMFSIFFVTLSSQSHVSLSYFVPLKTIQPSIVALFTSKYLLR